MQTERRVHKVFVTLNTEYHVKKATCVAVRDRKTGRWLGDHSALCKTLCGALRFDESGAIVPNQGTPEVGESLLFMVKGRDLVTSEVIEIRRPTIDTVRYYLKAA